MCMYSKPFFSISLHGFLPVVKKDHKHTLVTASEKLGTPSSFGASGLGVWL